MESIFDHVKNVDLQCAHLGETLRVVLNSHLWSDNDQKWKNDKTTSPNNTEISLGTLVSICFLFSFRTRPPQEKKNNKKLISPPNFSALRGPSFWGSPTAKLPSLEIVSPFNVTTLPSDEDSKLVALFDGNHPLVTSTPKKKECQTCVSIEAFGGKRPLKEWFVKNFQHEKGDRKTKKSVRSHKTLSKWMCMFQKQIAWSSGSMDQVDSGLWAWILLGDFLFGDFLLGIVLHYIS